MFNQAIFRFTRKLAGCMAFLLAPFLLQSSSFAQEAISTKALSPVIVNSVAGSFQAKYKDLLNGYKMFNKKKHYAPRSDMMFFVDDTSAKGNSLPLEIKFETRDSFYDVPVNDADFFSLPSPNQIGLKNSKMLANRRKDTIIIHPIVRTITDGVNITHLGDLRLECEVSWEIQKSAVPFYIRSAFFAAGRVCHSKHIAFSFYSPRLLSSVTLRSGSRVKTFRVARDGHTYSVPVYDSTWADDSVVEFNYPLVSSGK